MSLRNQLELQLRNLQAASAAMPTRVQVTDPSGIELRLELSQLDSMSCGFLELALFLPQLQNSTFQTLKQWGQDLSQRVSYLLENIGIQELDSGNGQILIRSTPPQGSPAGTQYYEVLLSSTGNGTFVLRRFRSISGQPGRVPVEMQVTYEVLFKLVDDLIATSPSVP